MDEWTEKTIKMLVDTCSLPVIQELLQDPGFIDACVKSGHQFDADAIFRTFEQAARWRFEPESEKKKPRIN